MPGAARRFNVQITQLGGEHPARTISDSPFVDLVTATAASLYGKPVIVAPMSGGPGPLYPFVTYLGVPIRQRGDRSTGEQCPRAERACLRRGVSARREAHRPHPGRDGRPSAPPLPAEFIRSLAPPADIGRRRYVFLAVSAGSIQVHESGAESGLDEARPLSSRARSVRYCRMRVDPRRRSRTPEQRCEPAENTAIDFA